MNFQFGPILFTTLELTLAINQNDFMKIKLLVLLCLVSLANCLVAEAVETPQTKSHAPERDATGTNSLNGYVCGKPTNDILAAIRFFELPQPNVMVCLLNVGQTNSRQLWIAPPQFQRVEYYLYDSSGKVVPYLATYHPANKIYKTISEVPKNVHNVYKGLMGSPFPMPYDQAILTNIFQIEHGGNYKLTAKGRIMKINADSSLSVVMFPPVSLTIHLADKDVPEKLN